MKTFRLQLLSPMAAEEIGNVESFMGRDSSGSFGILAGAERRVTALTFGLAQFIRGGAAEYLALPGGVLHFAGDEMKIATTHYLRSPDRQAVLEALDKKIRLQEEGIREVKQSLKRLDEEILKRLSRMKWRGEP